MRHPGTPFSFLLLTAAPALVCATLLAGARAGAQTPGSPSQSQSMLNESPQAPEVSFNQGALAVNATNSSLRAILNEIEARAGTKVQGLSHDVRIFGVYGPGKPQDVLASLLDSSGYNVLIVGKRADGAPREVLLTTRSTAPIPPPASNQATERVDDSADDQGDDGSIQPYQAPQPVFRPPSQMPIAPPMPQRARTPQEMLLELQRLRQQGLQNSQQPQPSPQQ